MIYTEMVKKAAVLAFKAHEGQFDKSGYPYVMHPLHVAEGMTSEDSTVVALLHDVVEDTDYTFEDLRNEGFTEAQLEAVKLLTKDGNEDYFAYVERIKTNPIAREVKIGDLKHNSDDSRLKEKGPCEEERLKKYKKSLEILNS